jgi:hypothetical protein
MVSHLFFYQLVLIALVWLCVMLQWAWPSDPAAACPPPELPPLLPKRKREPTPFAGLTTKPPCDACESSSAPRPQTPSVPPPRIVPTRGRRRQVDTSTHFCPNPDCRYHGWVGWGNLRANGHPNSGPWRQLLCIACRGYFLETLGTLLHGKRGSVELIVRVIACLAEGLGIRGTARVFEIDPNTVLQWLVDAAEQLWAFSQHVLHDVRVQQVQLDLAPDCAPLFLTDGFREYLTALLTHYGQWVQPPRRQSTGPMPKPRWMPRPQLLYAQVVKTVRRRRLVNVKHRVVFGSLEAVNHLLAPLGWHINTAFVERLNLSIRQHVAAVGRRVSTLCKHEAGLRQQLVLYQVYYNFCLPHASIRLPLPQPEPTSGSGSTRQWWLCTPAMAAGLTDHVWTLREVLLFRVPPWPQPVGV